MPANAVQCLHFMPRTRQIDLMCHNPEAREREMTLPMPMLGFRTVSCFGTFAGYIAAAEIASKQLASGVDQMLA